MFLRALVIPNIIFWIEVILLEPVYIRSVSHFVVAPGPRLSARPLRSREQPLVAL